MTARRALDLRGRVVVVTGASRGLGFAVARAFADDGARLAICARDADHLQGARRELEAGGAEVFAEPCDVTDADAVERFVAAVVARYGRLDVLVNSAGVMSLGPVWTQTLEDFHNAMDTMFWGVVHLTLAALPHLRAHGSGRVVNVTSIGGRLSPPRLLPYACAKYAAVGFSRGMHAELAADGVAVTTVVPGLMRTGSPRNVMVKGDRPAEYAWFALLANAPLITMSAERAARRIVQAARRGRAEVILGAPAHLACWTTGLFPGGVARLSAVAARMLPDAPRRPLNSRRGGTLESGLTASPLTALGRRAARRLREHPEESATGG